MVTPGEDENFQEGAEPTPTDATQPPGEAGLITIDDYLKDTTINRSNIRCISTSILSICGFLLPILFGVFYFIIKDSYDIKLQVSPLVIIALAVAAGFILMAILSSVEGVRVRNPPDEFSTRMNRYTYLKGLEDQERESSEKSIRYLKWALAVLALALILF
jgi:hypothetical protein